MDLYFYLLRHGSRKTKWMLGGIFLLFLVSLGGLLAGIFTKNFLLGASGFMLLIFSIVLLASISFEKVEKKEQQKKEEKMAPAKGAETGAVSAGKVSSEYSCAAEPPVQYRLSHLSRRSEPLINHTICYDASLLA